MKICEELMISTMNEKHLNNKKLAEMTGISKERISYIKNGANCSIDSACRIANALNIPLTRLVDDSADMIFNLINPIECVIDSLYQRTDLSEEEKGYIAMQLRSGV